MPRTYRLSVSNAAAAVTLAVALVFVPAVPAGAAPATPSALTSSTGLMPTLSWGHVPGADQYLVEINTSPSSVGVFLSSTTVNRHFVPPQPLPWSAATQTIYWRVTAKDTAYGDPSPWTPIYRSSTFPAPDLTSPTEGQTFTQPHDPATIAWKPVEGAQEYEIRISQDSSFADPNLITLAKTVSTSYVVPNPQVDTAYWVKVRARVSAATGSAAVFTNESTPRKYSVSPLPAADRSEPLTDTTVVEDTVLDWKPILGARTYDLQVATDPAFGSIVHTATDITGTSYARPQSLNNDQYYWRVRAEDVAGNVQAWQTRPSWRFERAWPDMVTPLYPAAPSDVAPQNSNDVDTGVTVGDPFYYEWQPVRFASMYKLELSNSGSFSPTSIVDTCYTRNTTFTPTFLPSDSSRCMPAAERTYWWRVSAMDQFQTTRWEVPDRFPMTSQVTEAFHDARFTYSPSRVTTLAPAHGATVQVPTLRWEPLSGAARYRVTVTPLSGGGSINVVTAATSFTPVSKLTAGVYEWDVVPVSELGDEGSPLINGKARFTVEDLPSATAAAPTVVSPLSGQFNRFPPLRWEPVEGAVNYQVRVRVANGTGWDILDTRFAYPAATDTGTDFLAPGAYEWEVDALGAGGNIITSSTASGHFDIVLPSTVTGKLNALSMAGYKAGQACGGYECTDLRQTPVLRWDPQPGVGYYRLWITKNANLSTQVHPAELASRTNPVLVSGTVWTPTSALKEATAGEAYYWTVQPCTSDGKCASAPAAVNSFNKASNPVDSQGPGVPVIDGAAVGTVPVLADDVTLSWTDYLATNQAAAQGSSQLTSKSAQAAREYEVQIDDDHTFATPLDTAVVDQRRFTTFDDTYPEGNIYWRVRAFDSSGNPLPWSTIRTFKKQSPTPTLNEMPTAASATLTFSWKPLDMAAAYEIEVFAKGSNASKYLVRSNQVKWSPTTAAQTLGPGEYEWWVRRIDAKNRAGGWSARKPLTVVEQGPVLSAPANGGAVAPRESLFTWDALPEAADYRVVLTAASGGSASQITKATSWAPTSRLAPGNWTWMVEARNSNGVVIGRSQSRQVTVTAALAATQPTRIEGSGQVDTVLLGYAPEWNVQSPDSVTFQWYRGSTPVGDGTLSYTVTVADVGQRIKLIATAAKAGHPNATSESNTITGTQGAAPTAATPPTITGSGLVGEALVGNPPTWNSPDVAMTYRWLVAGRSVGTITSYTPTAADLGKDVTFEVTGKRTNYANAVVASAPITVKAGGALQPTTTPSITGTPVVGQSLRASVGTWSQPSASFGYQWLRSGAPIPGATGSSYSLKTEDAGRQVAVTVVATKSGFNDGAATTAPVSVPKMASSTAIALSKTRVKPGTRVKIGITVAVPGVAGPTGSIKIFDGAKKLKTLTMVSTRDGKIGWKMPKLKKGKHKIKAVYLGNGSTAGSKSKITKLYVVR